MNKINQEMLFRVVVEGTGDAVYVKDKAGRYLLVNPAYLRDFGRPAEEVLGRTARDVFGPEEGERIAASEREVMSSGMARTLEETVSCIGQTYLANVSPYFDHDGHIAGVVGISRNITERKAAEKEQAELVQQLEAARAQAEEGTRAKSDFLACMSHEVRTPMNGVLGMSELLLETQLSTEQHEYVVAVHESARALLHVINDILDFSKIEAGKMEIAPVRFNLTEHIQSTIALTQPSARNKGLVFETHTDPDLPESVIADPTRLRQIVLNLLSNALKFTERGSIVLRVGISERCAGSGKLRLSVQDTGIGIVPEKLGHIFDKFAQADSSTTRRYGGTGLGLSISQQLARLMGGEIGVESKLRAGSTFWVEVPVIVPGERALAAMKTVAAARSETVAQPVDLGALRVLLAEDNVINQKVALSMLQKLGCRADLAQDGKEAVEMALRNSYDLILMDCEMPRLSGFEATAEILRCKTGASAPAIVALTAHAMVGYQERCFAAGMKGCLTKPVTKQDLLSTLVEIAKSIPKQEHALIAVTGDQ